MSRARIAVAAILAATPFVAGPLLAQQTTTSMPSVLAGKKVVPPLKGDAVIEFTAPQTARVGNNIVTKITVKNLSPAPVARLRVNETWYDKAGGVVGGNQGFINGLIQPNEIQVITIETPYKQGMDRNNFTFAHANGTVNKPRRVAKLEPAKQPAATPAAATKK
jgi:hypothetical protein